MQRIIFYSGFGGNLKETKIFSLRKTILGFSVLANITKEVKHVTELQAIALNNMDDISFNHALFNYFEHDTFNDDEAFDDLINNVNFDV